MSHSPNIDNTEIAKFSALADKWWDKKGPFKPLHDMNETRISVIVQMALPQKGTKVLDVGCGGGIVTESLALRGMEVTGIDMAQPVLQAAKLHAKQEKLNIEYILTTAEQLAEQRAEQYDIVTCLELLEHVPEPALVVAACAKLCKPGGKLIFSTINRNLKSWIFAIVGAEYVLQLLPKGTHHYKKLIKPSELAQMLRSADLELHKTTGVTYNPFLQKFALQQRDLSVNYIVVANK